MENIYRDEVQYHFLLQVSSHFSILNLQIRKENVNDLSLVHGIRWTGVSLKKEQALCVYHQMGRHIWFLRAEVLGCRCLEQMPASPIRSGDWETELYSVHPSR